MGDTGLTHVHPYASAMKMGFKLLSGHLIAAIRDPSARPSNVSARLGQLHVPEACNFKKRQGAGGCVR